MSCKDCNKPLERPARFCPNCGSPIERPLLQLVVPPPETALLPTQPSPPLVYYQLNTSNKGAQMFPSVVNAQSKSRPRRRFGGFSLGCLIVLLLILVLGAGGIFLLRSSVHNIAQAQIDQAMSDAVDQVPPQAPLLPAGSLAIQEASINNLVVLNLAPSSPVQQPTTHIGKDGIRIAFQLYGYPCAISAIPTLVNNRVVVTHVAVDGIIGFAMSADEMTALLNKHLSDAQDRLKHKVLNLQLKEHEMDLLLGNGITS